MSNKRSGPPAKKKSLKKIKSSVLGRGFSLAKLTLSTSTQLAGHGLSTFLANQSKKTEKWQTFVTHQAQALSQELGELKGSLMKAGQMLSMYGEHFLPAEANAFLKSLQSQSPPLEWSQIKKLIHEEFSQEKQQQLEIDTESIGSASLGQVHRAQIKSTGKWIALKIQYPGVKKAIDSDLKALRSLLALLKLLPKDMQAQHLFTEVRDMMIQETNYTQEAQETSLYRQRLISDERYIVPLVYPEYCTDRILASSLEEGLSPDSPVIQSLSQERRNRLALNFLELYFKELFHWGVVQTDPHFGNYKIRLQENGHDQLVLLDFGAVRKYPEEFLNPYCRMIQTALHGDLKGLEQATQALHFLREDDTSDLKEVFMKFCQTMVEPFQSGIYDWKNSNLPKRLSFQALQMIQKFSLRPPPREVLFLDRKTGGVFIFLSLLGAQIDGRPLLEKYLTRIQG